MTIQEFNSKYGVTMFDINALYELERRLKGLDEFKFQKSGPSAEVAAFEAGLKELMNQYVANHTKLQEKGSYNLSGFNMVDFIKDYEEVIAATAQENGRTDRKPFEGRKLEGWVKKAVDIAKPLNKHVSNIWSKNILDGKMSMSELERVTDAANTSLREFETKQKEAAKNAEPKQTGPKKMELDEDGRQQLANLVTAKTAMSQVRAKRGWLWKLFMRKQNKMEKAYLAKLEQQITHLTLKNFPVSDVMVANMDPVLRKPLNNAEKFMETQTVNKQETREKMPVNELNAKAPVEVAPPVKAAPSINAPTNQK